MALRIGLRGESGRLRYWGGYGYFGKEVRDQGGPSPQDQAGGNLGVELELGIVNPKIELARPYDNVAAIPTNLERLRPRESYPFTVRNSGLGDLQ